MAEFGSYEEQRRILEALKQIDSTIKGVDKTIRNMTDGAKKSVSGIGQEMKRTTDEAGRGLKALQSEQEKFVRLQVTNLDALSAKIDEAMGRAREHANKAFTNVDQSMIGNMLWGREGFNAISGKMGGLRQLMRTGQQEILGGLPAAGLIGLLLYGRNASEESRTAGEKAIQIFDRVKASTREQAREIGDLMRQAKIDGIDPGDFVASIDALAGAGIDADRALGKIRSSISGLEESTLSWSVRMDKAFEIGSGASAKALGEIMASTGAGIKEARTSVEQLGLAARTSGLDMTTFVGTMAQAASGMRMQKQDVDALTKTFSMLRGAMPGGSAQFTGQMAAGALGDITGAVGGLQTGLKDIIGQRILKQRFGTSGGPLSGVRAMELGFQEQTGGGSFDVVGESLKQLLSLKEEQTQGLGLAQKAEFLKAISGGKINGGLAQRLAGMTGEETGGVGDVAKEFAKELTGAFGRESDKRSPEDRMMDQARDIVARLGEALLTALANGFSTTAAGLTAVVRAIGDSKNAGLYAGQFAIASDKAGKRVQGSFERLAGSAEKLGPEAKDLIHGIIGDQFGLGDESQEDIDQYFGGHKKASRAGRNWTTAAVSMIPFGGVTASLVGAMINEINDTLEDRIPAPAPTQGGSSQSVNVNAVASDGTYIPIVVTATQAAGFHEPYGAGL